MADSQNSSVRAMVCRNASDAERAARIVAELVVADRTFADRILADWIFAETTVSMKPETIARTGPETMTSLIVQA